MGLKLDFIPRLWWSRSGVSDGGRRRALELVWWGTEWCVHGQKGEGPEAGGKVPPLVFRAGTLVGVTCLSKVPVVRNDLH